MKSSDSGQERGESCHEHVNEHWVT